MGRLQEFMEHEGVLAEDGTRDVPGLDRFEAQIAEVHAVETDVQAMPSVIIEGLLHINTQPLKQSLVVLVSKWIYLYTQSLQQRVRRTCQCSAVSACSQNVSVSMKVCIASQKSAPTAVMQVLESASELVAFMQAASAGLDVNVEADAVEDDAEVRKV